MRDLITNSNDNYWEKLRTAPGNIEKVIALSALHGYSDYAMQLLLKFKDENLISQDRFDEIRRKYIRLQKKVNCSIWLNSNFF